jgi:hypothetical protein
MTENEQTGHYKTFCRTCCMTVACLRSLVHLLSRGLRTRIFELWSHADHLGEVTKGYGHRGWDWLCTICADAADSRLQCQNCSLTHQKCSLT